MASTVTSRRKQLGNELRHARNASKLTQQQVAEFLGCTQGKVNKIESGAVGVKLGDVRSMLNAFGVNGDEAEALMNLARAAAGQRGQWSGYRAVVPHWFRTFTDLEPAAAEILTWHGERIPGPLQSEHYMLKQFTEAGATDVTSLVRNRLDRKAVFDQLQPPYYRFIISEGALRRAPGGIAPAVMLDQVEHLLVPGRSETEDPGVDEVPVLLGRVPYGVGAELGQHVDGVLRRQPELLCDLVHPHLRHLCPIPHLRPSSLERYAP